MNGEGLLVDIGDGSCQVIGGRIYDKVCNPCTMLEIKFTTDKQLIFSSFDGSFYFRYYNMDWVPYKNSFNMTSDGTFLYDITAFPKNMFKFITKPATNTMMLARAMGMNLSGMNASLKCPLINLNAYTVIQKHRLVSLQDAYHEKDLGKAVMMYCTSETMYCNTWYNITKKQAKTLTFDEIERPQVNIRIQDDRVNNWLYVPQSPRYWQQKDYLNFMTGIQYQFAMPKGANFLDVYTMKFDNTDQMDISAPFVCTKVEMNVMDSSKWNCTFTNVNLYKEKRV